MARSSICSNCGRDGQDEFIIDIPSSPIPKLLNNNQAPSSMEAALARTAIADIGPDLQRLEEEAARVRSILNQLEECRNALRSYRHNHEVVLSPIRRLPPETLGKIFMESLPDFVAAPHERNTIVDTAVYQWGKHFREAVLNLGQVCKHWRDVSVGTPQLWSSISLQPGGFGWRADVGEKLETWLQRSGEVPLKVHCSFYLHDISKKVWDPLVNRTHRWQDGRMSLVGKRYWEEVSHYFHRMPLLENLTIDIPYEPIPFTPAGGEPEQGRDWNIQIDAPSLCSLHINHYDHNNELPSLQLPFSQLTELKIHIIVPTGSSSVQRIINMLRETPNLVSCSLHFHGGHENPLDPMSPPSDSTTRAEIRLLHLQYLDIGGDGAKIFRHLHTPRLTEFGLATGYILWPLKGLKSLLSRSHCMIQKATMHFISGALGVDNNVDGELIEILQLVPEVRSLEILEFGHLIVTYPVVHRLNRKEEPCIVQGLKRLRISVPAAISHIDSLVDMIESRVMLRDDDHSNATLDGTSDILETVELVRNAFFYTNSESDDSAARVHAGERLVSLKAKGSEIVTFSSDGQDVPLGDIFLPVEPRRLSTAMMPP